AGAGALASDASSRSLRAAIWRVNASICFHCAVMVALSCSMVSSWYIRRDSSVSMRSESSFSLIGDGFPDAAPGALAQAVAERDAFVEHKAFAAPAAHRFGYLFQIFQDAALEMIDLRKPAGEQKRACLLAADPAGAEHRDLLVFCRIELLCGEILELPEACDVGIERAVEGADRDLEGVAGVDQERIGRGDQRVPVARLDMDADLPRRIDGRIAERNDLLLQAHLEPAKGHRCRPRILQLEMVEPATEERAMAQLFDQRIDALIVSRDRSVDALGGEQDAALERQPRAGGAQGSAQHAKIGKRGKLIEGGDLEGHRGGLSGAYSCGNPAIPALALVCQTIAEPGMDMPCNAPSKPSNSDKVSDFA